jgi:hypothetical protein
MHSYMSSIGTLHPQPNCNVLVHFNVSRSFFLVFYAALNVRRTDVGKKDSYFSVQPVRVDTSFEIDSLKDVSVYILESLNINTRLITRMSFITSTFKSDEKYLVKYFITSA